MKLARTPLVIAASLAFFLLVGTAQAGSLFPPDNLASPNTPCPSNQVLRWSGDSVVCADPSLGVSVAACPAGQVMAGISNGLPVCRTLTCRQVQAVGGPPTYISQATCNADEILTGGGGFSEVPGSSLCAGVTKSYLHATVPNGKSFVADAINDTWTGEACTAAVAICCKFQ